ncbi:unnamed protein product, partial [Allacma fusca]
MREELSSEHTMASLTFGTLHVGPMRLPKLSAKSQAL